MQQQLKINSAQYELLNVLSCVNKEEDVAGLRTYVPTPSEHILVSRRTYVR